MMERKHLHGITLLGGLAMALLCGCIRDELEPCRRCVSRWRWRIRIMSTARRRLAWVTRRSVRRIFPSGSMCRTWPIG